MSAPDRRAMVERPAADLSVRRQCALLNLTRSGAPAAFEWRLFGPLVKEPGLKCTLD